MADEHGTAQAPGGKTSGQMAAPQGAQFICSGCGHTQSLPEQLLGRQAKCPKCGLLGTVERPSQPEREPVIDDVKLDDLLEHGAPTMPAPSSATGVGGESLALTAVSRESLGGHFRRFFSGNFPLNLLVGLLGGVYECLVCLALALLVFSVPKMGGLIPHALFLTLFPAVLASALFALNGRLSVAVGAPDPASALCVFLLMAAVGGDLVGRASEPVIATTMLAALALAGVLSGVAGVLFSRLGMAFRVRFLSVEIVGGMLAGFGVLLVEAWVKILADGSPALTGLLVLDASTLGPALRATAWDWGPGVGFGLLMFLVRHFLRGILWPLLASALAVAAWNAAPHLGYGDLAAHMAGLPNLLDQHCYLDFFALPSLARIDWLALLARKEFFVVVAVVAILPSLVRTDILETVLGRDAEPDEQMRMVGGASMVSGLLGALPASLSLSGSLGLRALGAAGPVAGFTVGLVCLAFVLQGQAVLPFIPRFVPLGVLLAVGLSMPVNWLLRDARNPLTHKHDQRAAWTAALMVVLLGPVLGVFCCLVLGLFVSLSRAVTGGGIRFLQTGDVYHSNVDRSPSERRILRERGGQVLILRLHGFLFLGTFYGLLRTIRTRCESGQAFALKYVLLDFGAVTGLGGSAANGFKRLEQLAESCGLTLLLTSVPLEMEEHLEGLGYRMGGESGLCRLYLNMDYALEWCEDSILAEAAGHAAEGVAQRQDSLEELLAATFPEPKLVPALMKCLERLEVPRKRHIIQQGDVSDSMYFLQSGKVHVELSLPGGKVMRLKKMGAGTVFGEMGLYTSAPRSASVIATDPCVVYRLSAERFKLIQDKAPSLAAAVNRFIVTLLADRVAEENAKNRVAQLP